MESRAGKLVPGTRRAGEASEKALSGRREKNPLAQDEVERKVRANAVTLGGTETAQEEERVKQKAGYFWLKKRRAEAEQ